MIRFLCVAACCAPLLLTAQSDTTGTPGNGPHHKIQFSAFGAYQSTAIENGLVSAMYVGGHVDRELRQRTLDRLRNANRGGYALGLELAYTWRASLFGRPSLWPRISAGHRDQLGVEFNRDAFQASFFGNKPFEGRIAELGPGRFSRQVYQTFAFGVARGIAGPYIELGLVAGWQLDHGNIRNASLYTAPAGEYLELGLDGTYRRSDTARTSLPRGFGGVVNAGWNRGIHLLGSAATISIEVRDLGFIAWSANSLTMEKDTVIRFEGFEMKGILDLDDLVLNEHALQDSLGFGYRPAPVSNWLPAQVSAALGFGRSHVTRTGETIYDYRITAQHRFMPGFLPYATAQRRFQLSDAVAVDGGIAAGGFGGVQAILGISAWMGHGLNFELLTPNLLGFFSDRATGKGLGMRLVAAW